MQKLLGVCSKNRFLETPYFSPKIAGEFGKISLNYCFHNFDTFRTKITCKKNQNGFSREFDMRKKYWSVQNAFLIHKMERIYEPMTMYHYHNGECSLEKAIKCLEKLTKQFKIEKKRFKFPWPIRTVKSAAWWMILNTK